MAPEASKFRKAFDDPEFVKLFGEYAKEISDPGYREETEKYLKQLENEGRVREVYGEGVELIVPQAGFSIKTRNKETGQKVFINVCESEKVEKAKAEPRQDGSGTEWSIPYSLGHPTTEKDKGGKECEVHDFVVNPETLRLVSRSAKYKTFVIDTAIESVEKQRGKKLDRSFTLPRLKYKGSKGGPTVQAVTHKDSKDGAGVHLIRAGMVDVSLKAILIALIAIALLVVALVKLCCLLQY
ncbi:hypothetical protein CBR_g28803 [Chara braunii]|uniref:PIH1 N-terminal domain-containing protein n=1 Tax=Chara braunii TaxID=69332 RepID=A0A388L9U3_CHABU|nr:hypothetical protein CBR_g28803 [Chara braunii]|eukprot:GBG79087.1 hypothetical protein CBR_g28803 [Chara braunii]